MAKSTAVVKPNLGLYFDRPSLALDRRALEDGYNFRIKNGKLSNVSLGWERFAPDVTLNGPVTLIDDFILRTGVDRLIIGTLKDLYVYIPASDSFEFITPIINNGTAAASGTAVTGTTTTWQTDGVKAGDEISFGSASENDPAATWYVIQSVGGETSLTLTADAGTVVDGPYTIRSCFTGNVTNLWITDTFANASPSNEDEWWATNGLDSIVRWNGTDAQVEKMSASLGFTCKYLRVFKNMMLFFNLLEGGVQKSTSMINSDVGQPQNAGLAGTGLSEQFIVTGGTDEIMAALPIGDSLAIYCKTNVTVTQFVGDPDVFIFRTAIDQFGLVASKGVADMGNTHSFISKDSQYTFDGVTVKEINPHVWREIIRQQDPVRVRRIFHHFDDENGDLIWSVPSSTDIGAGTNTTPPLTAYTEHYLEGTFEPQYPTPHSRRAFPFTAAGYYYRQAGITWDIFTETWQELNFRWNDQFFFSSFPLNIVGDDNGKLYSLNTAQSGDGVDLPSYVVFGRRATWDGKARALVTRVYPFVTSFQTHLHVILGLADHAGGPATIADDQEFDQTLPEGVFFTTHYRRGRYFQLVFGTDTGAWELSGYDIDVRPGGKR